MKQWFNLDLIVHKMLAASFSFTNAFLFRCWCKRSEKIKYVWSAEKLVAGKQPRSARVPSNPSLPLNGIVVLLQLPQFILDDWIERGVGAQCKIVCTQPRRISAISVRIVLFLVDQTIIGGNVFLQVSERIARERAEKLGHSVGYQIRLEQ